MVAQSMGAFGMLLSPIIEKFIPSLDLPSKVSLWFTCKSFHNAVVLSQAERQQSSWKGRSFDHPVTALLLECTSESIFWEFFLSFRSAVRSLSHQDLTLISTEIISRWGLERRNKAVAELKKCGREEETSCDEVTAVIRYGLSADPSESMTDVVAFLISISPRHFFEDDRGIRLFIALAVGAIQNRNPNQALEIVNELLQVMGVSQGIKFFGIALSEAAKIGRDPRGFTWVTSSYSL